MAGVLSPFGGGATASQLADLTGTVNVGSAAAPSTGQALLASSAFTATWGSAGGVASSVGSLNTTSSTVSIGAATAPGGAGSVLVTTGASTGVWSSTLGSVAFATNAGTSTITGNLSGGTTFPAYVAPAISTLSMATSITVNAALGNDFAVTLTAGTGTLATPTNPVDGQIIRFRVTQGGAGTFSLAYSAAYNFGAAGAPTLSKPASDVDILGFQYVLAIPAWCFLGAGLGF